MSGSKILVIAPFPTDPMDAGNRARVVNLIQELRRAGNEVHFVHVQTSEYDGEAMAQRIGADRLHLFPYVSQPPDRSRAFRWARRAGQRLGVDSAYTWPLDSWYPPQLTPMLASLQQRHHFDAVIVTYVFMSKAFDAFPKPCLRVLDTHDRMGNRHRTYQQAGMRPDWFSTTPKDEETGFRRADVVLAIQSGEADDFERRLGASPRVLTVGHLVDLPLPEPLSEKPAAMFLGSHNPINIRGLEYFLGQVQPLVRRAVPDFELIVAGPVSQQVADQSGLVKLGYVDDLRAVFRSSMLFVNPVLMGTGIAIKLLDAMAHGMPCVCTRSGARGLPEQASGIDVVEDDDANLFAQRIIDLLRDPALRQARRTAARTSAEQWNRQQLHALSGLLGEIGQSNAD